ncbi:hypothetical protein K3495_g632 [Podosphaera aphanis]|nr:hypothetical protein K3495_g632 [Podosphaera aphanis]
MSQATKAFVIGISGASSSGKTTLSRLLRDIFPNTIILHQDDFYKPEVEIPVRDDLQDWDCADALNLPAIVETLQHVRSNGSLCPATESKEDMNEVSSPLVPESTIAALKEKVAAWTAPGQPGHILLTKPMYLFEGFLMYSHSTSMLWPYLDLKIFLQVSYAAAKARREGRNGYVTMDGFWKDPPNYVDKIVWPNYCHEHEWMFENNDVEGKVKNEVDGLSGVQWPSQIDVDIEIALIWAVDVLMRELPSLDVKAE